MTHTPEMRLLVLHQNFPGQFGHMVKAWAARPGWQVRGLGRETAPGLPGFGSLTRYKLARGVGPAQHAYLRQMEAATLHGQAVARELLKLKQQEGYRPDAVLAHPGWGESLYVKDVFPDTRLVHLCEWYYNGQGADMGFDPEFPVTLDDRLRVRTWNALHTLNLAHCDAAITPTQWQLAQHPAVFRPKMTVQHEGIAVHELGPDPNAWVKTPSGTVLKAGDPVVTYVARNLEPYRGFHIFMRALAKLQQRHPTVQAIIVGGDDVSYGRRPKDAPSWREHMLREVKLDATRTHFVGKLPRAAYVKVLQMSAAHVYLTYPFVLSWSLLEAMACAAPIVASDTAPVREVVRHGVHGVFVNFFAAEALAGAMLDKLVAPAATAAQRVQARREVQRYELQAGLMGYERLLLGPQAPKLQRERQGPAETPVADGAAAPVPVHTEHTARAAGPVAAPVSLTAVDAQLLQLLAAGHSTQAIARLRHRSPATVRNQLSALYQKLGVSTRAEVLERARALLRSQPDDGGRENPLMSSPTDSVTPIVTPS